MRLRGEPERLTTWKEWNVSEDFTWTGYSFSFSLVAYCQNDRVVVHFQEPYGSIFSAVQNMKYSTFSVPVSAFSQKRLKHLIPHEEVK